jgi:hypothetical protein
MSGGGAAAQQRIVSAGDYGLAAIRLSKSHYDPIRCTPETQKLLFTTKSKIVVGPVEVALGEDTKVVHTPPCIAGGVDRSMVCEILPVDGPNGAKWCVEAKRANAVAVMQARDGTTLSRAAVMLASTALYNINFLDLGEARPISPGDIVLIYKRYESSTGKLPRLVMALVFSHAQELCTRISDYYLLRVLSHTHNSLLQTWKFVVSRSYRPGSFPPKNVVDAGKPSPVQVDKSEPDASYYGGLVRVVAAPVFDTTAVRPRAPPVSAAPVASAAPGPVLAASAVGSRPSPILAIPAAPTAAAVISAPAVVRGTNFTFGVRHVVVEDDEGGSSAEKRSRNA